MWLSMGMSVHPLYVPVQTGVTWVRGGDSSENFEWVCSYTTLINVATSYTGSNKFAYSYTVTQQ